jgi:hypothetical protein
MIPELLLLLLLLLLLQIIFLSVSLFALPFNTLRYFSVLTLLLELEL